MPTSTARRVRSSSQSIRSSAKVRVAEFPQYEPIRSTRSESARIKNVEQLGARSWPERVQTPLQPSLEFLWHRRD
jgi:hypothetical protein